MAGRTVLATLGGRGPSQRLQVGVSQADDGRLLIDLREQHHAEGNRLVRPAAARAGSAAVSTTSGRSGIEGGVLGEAIEEEPATVPFPGPASEARAASGRWRRPRANLAGHRVPWRAARATTFGDVPGRTIGHRFDQPTFWRLVLPWLVIASSRFLSSFSRWSTPSCSSVQISSRTTRRPTSFSPQSSSASV